MSEPEQTLKIADDDVIDRGVSEFGELLGELLEEGVRVGCRLRGAEALGIHDAWARRAVVAYWTEKATEALASAEAENAAVASIAAKRTRSVLTEPDSRAGGATSG